MQCPCLIPCSMAPARAQPPIHLTYTIPTPPQLCSLLLRALLSIWQHLQLLPPLLAGQLCHQMCHCPAALFLLTRSLQQAHSLCCQEDAPPGPGPALWERGEGEKGRGSGRGKGEGNRKGEKQSEEQEGGIEEERRKGKAEGGRRKGERGERGRSQPAGRGRRQHLQHQPLDFGIQRSKKCRCEKQR